MAKPLVTRPRHTQVIEQAHTACTHQPLQTVGAGIVYQAHIFVCTHTRLHTVPVLTSLFELLVQCLVGQILDLQGIHHHLST